MAHRPEELIWGVHPVMEYLLRRPGLLRKIILRENDRSVKLAEIEHRARAAKIMVERRRRITIPGADQAGHQGVLALISRHMTTDLAELISRALENAHPLLVAVDSIQDPHNLGAIIRSAAAAGAAGIIIPKDRNAPLDGTAAKVSAGAVARIPISRVANLVDSLQRLKKAGFWIYGTDGRAKKSIYANDFSGPVCIVIGSEGKGLRPLVRKSCDGLVKIPMPGETESLNAGVAAGIVLFEIVRRNSSQES